jgi:hypothetical protein
VRLDVVAVDDGGGGCEEEEEGFGSSEHGVELAESVLECTCEVVIQGGVEVQLPALGVVDEASLRSAGGRSSFFKLKGAREEELNCRELTEFLLCA